MATECYTKLRSGCWRGVRQDDLVVRHGGDEFVVLLDTVALAATSRAPDRYCIAAEIRSPVALADGQLIVSASIGLAMAYEAAGIADLLEMADQAMYRVKRPADTRAFRRRIAASEAGARSFATSAITGALGHHR